MADDPAASADRLMAWLLDRAAAGLNAAGERLVADTKAELGHQAPTTTGPRSGRRAVGALLGNYPNRRSGTLQAGVTAAVEREGDAVALTVTDPVPYAAPLQARGLTVTSPLAGRGGDVANAIVAALNER